MDVMSAQDAWAWHARVGAIRGCNYVPRSAVNATEMWQAETFDPATIDQELGWAQQAGYNSVRIFVQYRVWQSDPAGQRARLDRFLSIAARRGISVMPVLFCYFSLAGKEPYLGRQDDPVPGVHNSGWVPSPGLQRVADRAAWPDLEAYVRDLVGVFAGDPRVIVWDLYNEPGNSHMGDKSLPLVEAAFAWARAALPTQPLTVGVWSDFEGAMSWRLMALSDVVSFHAYDAPPGVVAKIEQCQAWGRPLLCTEWLFRQSGNTFDAILPLFARARAGWFHWGLVAGRTQTYMPWESKAGDPVPALWQHDVFHPDGSPYDADEMALVRGLALGRKPNPL